MKLWFAIAMITVTLVSVTLLRGQVAVPGSGIAIAPGAGGGRYQLIPVPMLNANSDLWMIDTQTGDTWRHVSNRWSYMGNPSTDPGTRFPSPAGPGRAAP